MTNVKDKYESDLITEILNSAAFSNRWRENYLNIVMRVAVALGGILFIYVMVYDDFRNRIIMGLILILLSAVTFVPISFSIRASILSASLFLIATVILLNWGISSDPTIFLLAFIAISALLFDYRFGLVALSLSIITMTITGWLVLSGVFKLLTVTGTSGLASDWIIYSLDMTATGAIIILALYFLKREFNTVLRQVRESFQALQIEQTRLEDSTAHLVKANQEIAEQATREATRLRTIAEVARTAVAITEPVRLMNLLVNLISDRLGFYHIGIFLLDEQRQYAILSASNSDGGRRMLAKGHRLQVGQQGIVGFVSYNGKPRIALDVGADAIYFNNPDLPETRSEMCLPLKVNEIIIGALDIQSTVANEFNEDDSAILSILADQVAIAIQNAKANEEIKRALQEAEVAYSQLAGRAWKIYSNEHDIKGYSFRGLKAEPINSKTTSVENPDELNIPIRLRGQVIGSLKLARKVNAVTWTDDELAITQATADRVALALESARLLEDSQRRASKERVIGEVTSKISRSINLQNILQTAVEELGRVIPGSDVVIQFQSDSENGKQEKRSS